MVQDEPRIYRHVRSKEVLREWQKEVKRHRRAWRDATDQTWDNISITINDSDGEWPIKTK